MQEVASSILVSSTRSLAQQKADPVARRGTSFAKLDRERDKRAKAQAKKDRRAARDDAAEAEPAAEPAPSNQDNAAIMEALDKLHAAKEAGTVKFDDFEVRRDELMAKLQVD
jgi:hypothetical protein